ncbi:hypothetical protein ACWD25_21085 [Streptomyces sp. NPDC002920]
MESSRAPPRTTGRSGRAAVRRRHRCPVATIARVLTGHVLPDISALTRLEDALDHQLWPGPAAVRASAATRRRPIRLVGDALNRRIPA